MLSTSCNCTNIKPIRSSLLFRLPKYTPSFSFFTLAMAILQMIPIWAAIFLVLPRTSAAGTTMQAITADLTDVDPTISVSAAVSIIMIVLAHRDLLRLHFAQVQITHQPQATAWVTRLAESVFSMVDINLPADDHAASARLIMKVANAVAWHNADGTDVDYTSLIHPVLISPLFKTCQVCGDWLKLVRDPRNIVIAEENGVRSGHMIYGTCSSCKTTHFPDRYRARIDGELTSIYHHDPDYIKIGGKVWAHRELCITQSMHRYKDISSSEGLADFFSERYGTKLGFTLTPVHAWRLFVLHESLKLCSLHGEKLAWTSYDNIDALCKAVMDRFFPGDVKMINGGLDHHCAECRHPLRTAGPNGVVSL